MTVDNIYLWINALLWLFTMFIYVRKRGKWTMGYVILLLYTIISFIGIHLYNNEYSDYYFEPELTLGPFIFLYIMIIFASMPILSLNEKRIEYIVLPNQKIINTVAIFTIVFSFLNLFRIIPNLIRGLVMMSADIENAHEIYDEVTFNRLEDTASLVGIDFIGIFGNLANVLVPLVLCVYLTLPKKNTFLMIGLLLSIVVSPLEGIARASRIMMIAGLIDIVILMFFFKNFIMPATIKKVYKVGVVSILFILFYFVVISLGRSGGDVEYMFLNYERYFAEGPIVFNNYCMDANGTREGNIVSPLFKTLTGNQILSEADIRQQYSYMSIDNSRFSTFVGDYVLDYGPLFTAVLFLLIAIIVSRLLDTKKVMSFSKIILLYILMRFITGFYQYKYSGMAGNVAFVALIASYFFFTFYQNHDRHKIYIKKV